MMMGTGARVRSYSFSIPFLKDFCTEGKILPPTRCVEGIPKGSKIIFSHVDVYNMVIKMVVSHDSFKELEPTEPIPEFECKFEVVR